MTGETGLMTQYLAIKNQHKDAVVFFHVGGFYQVYYHDAKIAETEFGMTCISRAIGGGKRAPMCGFPISGGEKYIARFTEKGYRVVVCSQCSEDGTSGKTVRKVARIVEPQTGAVDLTEAWDRYLKERPFEEQMAPQTRPKKSEKSPKEKKEPSEKQMPEKEGSLLSRLAALDLSNLTPLMALNLLQEWKEDYIYES